MSVRTIKTLTLWSLFVGLMALTPRHAAWALGTPAGTIIRNAATATFHTADGFAMPPARSNEVTTVVTQVAAVDVTPATARNEVGPGSTVVFPVQVTNLGNGLDTFDLTRAGLPPEWTSVLYRDTNRNGVLDPQEASEGNIPTAVTLAADSVAYLLIPVTPPITAEDGDSASVTLTATSQFDQQVKDSGVYTAFVATSVLSVLKFVTPVNPKPFDIVTYTIQIENTGSRTAYNVVAFDTIPNNMTYHPGSIRYGGDATITYDNAQSITDNNDVDAGDFGFTAGNRVTVKLDHLSPGAVRRVFFRTTINEGVRAGTVINNKATGTFEYPPGFPLPPKDSPLVPVTVDFRADPRIAITSAQGIGEPGDTLRYVLKIRNRANEADVLNLTGQSSASFDFIIWVDANRDSIPGNAGDFKLTDTNNDTRPDVGRLTQNDSLQLVVQVIITPGALDSTIDVNTLTLVSGTDPTVLATGTVITRVKGPRMAVVKTVTPPGTQPAGQTLLYTVTITNKGLGTAYATKFNDAVPEFTTYIANSVTVDSTARTDSSDADDTVVENGVVRVDLGTMTPGATRTVAFRVKINE